MAKGREVSAATPDILIDATEQLLREEGYAAISARRVAQKAGLKNHQGIYYYFKTHEDLFLAVFRRRGDKTIATLEAAARSPAPLRALWRYYREPNGSWFTSEFMALSNRFETVRAELECYNTRFRKLELAIVERQAALSPGKLKLPPVVLCLMIASLSRVLARETAMGQHIGHDEADAYVENLLSELD